MKRSNVPTFPRTHVALFQALGVGVCLPGLLFPAQLPSWAPLGSLVALAGVAAAGLLLARRAVVRTPLDLPIWLMLFLLPASAGVSADLALTLPQVYKVVAGAAAFYAVVGLLEETGRFGAAAWAICALALLLAAILLFGTRWGGGKLSWLPFDLGRLVPLLVRPFWKPEGFLGFNANLTGGTLAMLIPVPLAYALFDRDPWLRLAALAEAAIVGLLLLFTRSRGAILAAGTGTVVMLAARIFRFGGLRSGGRRRAVALLAALALGAALAGQLLSGDLLSALLGGDAASVVSSAEVRLELWSRGWMMMQDFAFTGVGLGMVVQVLPVLYPTFLIAPDAGIEHMHNLYIQAGAEQGFPGLVVLLAFLMGLFAFCWRTARRARGTQLEPLALGMLGVIVVVATHGLVETLPFSPKANLIAWALFGVAVSAGLRFEPRRATGA